MSITLFEHNQRAYEAACAMMEETGKAAVIHPTGTGKSFIAFRLCEAHPEKQILWLSPSEYIYHTQLENLRATADGWTPGNVFFCTYAKLMWMSPEEMDAIQPDYIVLDEFHRCGAQMWGEGVRQLLRRHAEVPVLGLSATAIRYLDNQRDMAEELFEGNVASEMTLGEAIVRGILQAPTYVMSIFSYRKELEQMQAKIRRSKNREMRDRAEMLLEALRRALEKADGLEDIFQKHMKDRTGKYIVFCSNYEHLQEMRSKTKEWFGKVDAAPHVYTVYSEDPLNSQAFRAFKQDESAHLKLLFCIDMLNEGIHVDNVSGVILFRPTVSPILYKQQLGRALAAGKYGEPVVFDIVNNIENLFAIDAVRREMDDAANYYRFMEEETRMVREHFQIIDEVRDAKRLFEALSDTLSASWDVMYGAAKRYYQAHQDLLVPRRYKTPEGYSLGNWIFTQRKVYAGEQYGHLDDARIQKLEAIGMVWDGVREQSWKRYVQAATHYYRQHGDLKVPATYVTPEGIHLGAWIARMRMGRKNGTQKTYLTPERMAQLNAIGMVWDAADVSWEENFADCQAFYRTHGHLDIPHDYVSERGLRIGTWILRQRKRVQGSVDGTPLTEEQIQRLTDIGMRWEAKSELIWRRGLSEAEEYVAKHGDLSVPRAHVSPSGFRLGAWVADRRERGRENHSPKQQEQLDRLGMAWEKSDPWDTRFAFAKRYFQDRGHLHVPADYTIEGIWLGKWLDEQKQIFKGNRPGKRLTEEQIRQLESIGMDWRTYAETVWQQHYQDAQEYYRSRGDLNVPPAYVGASGKPLRRWILTQRKRYREGKLTLTQITELETIGMTWETEPIRKVAK